MRYIDSLTSAEFNVTYPLEVLSPQTYARYKTLGVIADEPILDISDMLAPSYTGGSTEEFDEEKPLIEKSAI